MCSLDLRVKRPLKRHPDTEWPSWTSEAKVIADMLKHSGLQDKTVAIEINIEPAILSKAQTGLARLSEGHMDALMDACGSEAWLHYWVLKRGYDPRQLHRMQSDVEKENDILRSKLEQMERDREVELRLYSRLKTA